MRLVRSLFQDRRLKKHEAGQRVPLWDFYGTVRLFKQFFDRSAAF